MLGRDITLAITAIDDSWARDAGPCFLVDGRGSRAGVDFRFNAWGGKYHPHDSDDAFAAFAIEQANARAFSSKLIAEGGGVSVDGEGTILTTETCFPNSNRNPDWSRDEIEQELMSMLGGDKVIWLPGNADETETDGHVDGIATFVAPGVVLVEGADDPSDPWVETKRANLRALEGQTDAKGRRIKLITIPEALEVEGVGDRFCRSYVNSYFVNGGVVMPNMASAATTLCARPSRRSSRIAGCCRCRSTISRLAAAASTASPSRSLWHDRGFRNVGRARRPVRHGQDPWRTRLRHADRDGGTRLLLDGMAA